MAKDYWDYCGDRGLCGCEAEMLRDERDAAWQAGVDSLAGVFTRAELAEAKLDKIRGAIIGRQDSTAAVIRIWTILTEETP